MMRMIKVLNTSVVLVLDDQGREAILMGKGIGFRKSIGDTIEVDDSDKIFVLRDRNVSRDIIRLASEVNAEYFGITKEIIDYARRTYHMNLMEHIYLALTDHLAFAVKRAREGMSFPEFYSLEVRRFHPEEYAMGRYALEKVKEELSVELPESEICSIAFHFINAQKDGNIHKDHLLIFQIMRDISEIVKYTFGIVYDADSIAYSRFASHLQAMAQRAVMSKQLSGDAEILLQSGIIEKCEREWSCVGKIADYLDVNYKIVLTEQEKIYLVIHIYRILEETAEKGMKE